MHAKWRKSIVVPFYRNEGDIQSCVYYRAIKLMSHTMKLWKRVIEGRLRQESNISENQWELIWTLRFLIYGTLTKEYCTKITFLPSALFQVRELSRACSLAPYPHLRFCPESSLISSSPENQESSLSLALPRSLGLSRLLPRSLSISHSVSFFLVLSLFRNFDRKL